MLGLLARRLRDGFGRFLQAPVLRRNTLSFSCVVYLALFVLGRLWFFSDCPVPAVRGDTSSYYEAVSRLRAWIPPNFSIRSPGYPLFLTAVHAVSASLVSVVVVQCLFAAASGLCFIYAVHRWRPTLALGTAAALGAFALGASTVDHDTALLTESLYVSAMFVSFAFLILAFTSQRPALFATASAAMAWVMLIRPAGAFLIVIYLLVLAFLIRNRYQRRARLMFAIPLPAVILALVAYNTLRSRSVTPTAFGESQIAFATLTFWQQDERYPAEVNRAIERARKIVDQTLTAAEREALRSSWEPDRLWMPFLKGFSYPALNEASRLFGVNDYLLARPWIRKISFDAVAKTPGMYLKFVYTQLVTYHANVGREEDLLATLNRRGPELTALLATWPPNWDPYLHTLAKEVDVTPRVPSVELKIFGAISWARQAFFANRIWTLVFVVVLAWSGHRVWRTRARDQDAVLVLLLNLSVLGASLVVCLVEAALTRYSYTMEFVYYLDAALWPVLLGVRSGRTGDATMGERRSRA